jgi:hypothetical protein
VPPLYPLRARPKAHEAHEPVAGSRAAELMRASAPRSPSAHLVAAGGAGHLLVPNGSQVYELDAAMRRRSKRACKRSASRSRR